VTGAKPWLFFDLGWTLVDESAAQRVRFAQAVAVLARNGVQSSVEELWALSHDAAAEFAESPFAGALARLGVDADVLQRVRTGAIYDHTHERLYPGVDALLARLGESYPLGVIANQSRGTEQRLREHGIRERFAVVAASAELGFSKPDPRIFEHAARCAGCTPDAAIMIGDRLENDIAPARRLGWRTVRVVQGFSSAQRPRSPDETPNVAIASIAELADVLD